MPCYRALLAEFFGTFFLCFAGIGAILSTAAPISSHAGLVGVALAHGLALSVAVNAFGGISGAHFNPAITIGMWTTRMIGLGRALGYIIAQILGSTIAAALCFAIYPLACLEATDFAIPLPPLPLSADIPLTAVATAEFVMTFLLMMAIFGTAVDVRGQAVKIGGFGIGLTVAFDILAGGPISGASMNPARSLGPTLMCWLTHSVVADRMAMIWQLHWVYWAAPVAGAVVGAQVYTQLLLDKKSI